MVLANPNQNMQNNKQTGKQTKHGQKNEIQDYGSGFWELLLAYLSHVLIHWKHQKNIISFEISGGLAGRARQHRPGAD